MATKKTTTKTAPKAAAAKAPEKKAHAKLSPTQEKTTGKLVGLAHQVLKQVDGRKNPTIAVPTRSLANTFYDEKKKIVQLGDEKINRQFFNVSMAKKFMQTFLVADACKELIESGKTTSIRDLYYITKHTLGDTKNNTFEEQEESDPIIEDLEVTVNSLREELHLFASNKGAMAGELTLVDAGDTIDLRKVGSGGWSVPSIVESNVVQFKKCDAQYVMLVEKDAVWRRLNEDKFWKKNKCIIVHGGGQPPRGVRRLVRRMNEELKLPVYVMVDNDPWGFYIYSVIKQGSINLAYESMRMAVPQARFIGLSSFDRDRFALPNNVTIKLDDTDVNRAKQMLSYKWFDKPQWKREIEHMLKSGVKLEIEALSSKGISFITEEYLPKKLRDRDWLE
jgi:DNA topoisomerase-6 subunit A